MHQETDQDLDLLSQLLLHDDVMTMSHIGHATCRSLRTYRLPIPACLMQSLPPLLHSHPQVSCDVLWKKLFVAMSASTKTPCGCSICGVLSAGPAVLQWRCDLLCRPNASPDLFLCLCLAPGRAFVGWMAHPDPAHAING